MGVPGGLGVGRRHVVDRAGDTTISMFGATGAAGRLAFAQQHTVAR
jgi:hypothetical protein